MGPVLIDEHQIVFGDPNLPFARGGTSEIFVGVHISEGKVAVKRLRLYANPSQDGEFVRRFEREGRIWQGLISPFLQPFIGIYFLGGRICLVSPFEDLGSLPKFVKRHPDADKGLLLCQAALGIAYLHDECNIIHGDIKGDNILVSRGLVARICDLGLARPDKIPTSAGMKCTGTLPWQSPEIFFKKPKSFQSDVYAFAMTIAEVLQGEKPFSQYRLPGQVVAAVLLRKERPAFDPSALGPGARYVWAWKVAEKCWNTNPQDRPTAHQAACYLHPDYQDVRIGLKLRRYAIGVMVLALTISAFFFALTKLFVVPIPTSPLCFSDTVSVPMIIHYTFSPDLDDLCRP